MQRNGPLPHPAQGTHLTCPPHTIQPSKRPEGQLGVLRSSPSHACLCARVSTPVPHADLRTRQHSQDTAVPLQRGPLMPCSQPRPASRRGPRTPPQDAGQAPARLLSICRPRGLWYRSPGALWLVPNSHWFGSPRAHAPRASGLTKSAGAAPLCAGSGRSRRSGDGSLGECLRSGIPPDGEPRPQVAETLGGSSLSGSLP